MNLPVEFGNVGIFDVIGVHDRHVELAQQRDEFGVAETIVANLDDVPQRLSVEFCRQQFEEAAEVGSIEFLGRRELPEQGTKSLAEFGYAGIKKPLDRVARFLEHAPVGRKTRALERELETVWHFARPFAERCRRLGTVEGAIDLDRGEPLGGVSELLRMRQTFRIEISALIVCNDLAMTPSSFPVFSPQDRMVP